MNGTKTSTVRRTKKAGGVDISKGFLDVAIDDPAVGPTRFPNSLAGRRATTTRRDRFREASLIAELEQEIAHLNARRRAALKALLALVRQHADLAERLDLLVTIDGVGERTALTLVVRMPELGTLSREQAASLAGMAPFTRQSGRWDGQARVEGGRGRVGKALFAAAQAAAQRWNKALVETYRRLRARGKHHNVAIVACARKLVIYANLVLTRRTPWVPQT